MSKNKLSKNRIVVFDDVIERDGIGLEFYQEDELLVEIFRDDSEKTRTVKLFKEVPLEFLEKSIEIFKQEIPWDFIED